MNVDHPIIQKLLSLDLPRNDYAVFGSFPMFVHGLKDTPHDLDVIARGTAWEKACTLAKPEIPPSRKGFLISLHNGEIEIFNDWTPGAWDIDELIDAAESLEGIKFVSLQNVLKWKKKMNREKDSRDIRALENYLRR